MLSRLLRTAGGNSEKSARAEESPMKLFTNCLLAAACIILSAFTASRCTAQDANGLLHAGMLGFTANEEEDLVAFLRSLSAPLADPSWGEDPRAETKGTGEKRPR